MSEALADPFRVDGKVALITGAGGGIGAAIAASLSTAGATVVVTDLDETAALRTAAAIEGAGGRATGRRIDVSRREDVEHLVSSVVDEHGHLDILVNNAGIQSRGPALEVTSEVFDSILGVNLHGVLHGCQAAGKVMAPGSSIINILSFAIDRPTVGTLAYGASKSAAWSLTRTFATELGSRGIRVNGVAPGWTLTELSARRAVDANGEVNPELLAQLVGQMSTLSPLGVVMEPSDSAWAVVYLASEAGRYLTGQVIRVNGGATME